jgi:crotonobetainyl-CoA:carnitine CoA-transferase CaiB-like acyl-CoA transferase
MGSGPGPHGPSRNDGGKSDIGFRRPNLCRCLARRIVDLTRILAGAVRDDAARRQGGRCRQDRNPRFGRSGAAAGAIRNGISWYFAAFNRNKQSLTLNLRDPDGRAVL